MFSQTKFRLDGGSNPLIVVPVHLNGEGPYQFILDTGASHSLLSQELATALGVQPEQERSAMGAGGGVKLALAHAGSIAVGSMRQDNVPVAITGELQRIGLAIQSRVDGCLGYSFLKDFVLTIDYQHKLLYHGRPSDEAGGRCVAPARYVPFNLASASKPLMLVPVRVNGQGPYQFTVDTGSAITVISRGLASKLNIATAGGCAGMGGGGQVSILGCRVDSIAVGDASVRDQAIGIGDFLKMLSTAAGVELDGIIGHSFLSAFRVTIDYPGGTLELSPTAR